MTEKFGSFRPMMGAGLAAVLLLGGAGYYYGVHIPAKERQEAQYQAAKAAAYQEMRERKNMAAYNQCVVQVNTGTRDLWNRHCEIVSAENRDNRKNCYLMGYNKGYCNITFPDIPPSNCLLPQETHDKYMAKMDQKKIECQSHLHDN